VTASSTTLDNTSVQGLSIDSSTMEHDRDSGFMNSYSKTSFEEDFNQIAELIMMAQDRDGAEETALAYPKLRAKIQIVVDFYDALGVQHEWDLGDLGDETTDAQRSEQMR